MQRRFGKADIWFLGILVLFLTVFCVGFYSIRQKQGTLAVVTVEGDVYGVYELKQEQTIEIKKQNVVTNVLKIQNGKVDMITANCPDHLCVHQRAISREKETIVCLPNRVFVEVRGAEESNLDAVT